MDGLLSIVGVLSCEREQYRRSAASAITISITSTVLVVPLQLQLLWAARGYILYIASCSYYRRPCSTLLYR